MKTFTTYAEKKAKQFLNLLQGYTKGIRITAILILLLMGVNNAWGADNEYGNNKVIYLDITNGSTTNGWRKDQNSLSYKIKMYYNNSDNSSEIIGEYCCTRIGTSNIYYTTTNNGYVRWVQALRCAGNCGDQYNYSNRVSCASRSYNHDNCIILPKNNADWWNTWTPTWTCYVPGIFEASINNTSTVYGGDGTEANPYQIRVNSTLSVNASATSIVPEDNAPSKEYQFSLSTNSGTRTTKKSFSNSDSYSFTASATAGTKYAIDVEARNNNNSNIGQQTATSRTLYYVTISPVYAILGSFNDWTHSANTWDLSDQGSNNWEATFHLDQGSHTFKVVYNSSYYGKNSTTITRSSATASDLSTSGADINLTADYAGNYTFTFNSSTNKLTVTYPTIYKVTYSHVPTAAADAPTTSPSVTSGNSVVAGTSVTFTAKDAKPGYAWKGWYDNNSGTGEALSTDKVYTRSITANTTIYAVYTAKTSNVTLNPQPGEGGTTFVDATTGSAMPDIDIPTRHGYTFGGYYDQEAGNGTQYYNESGKSAKDWDKEGDVILYAKWTATPYTITYNTNGGNAIANGSYTIEEAFILPTPTKIGSTFEGWFDNSELTGEAITTIASGSTGNKEYWAKWNIGTYTIEFDMEGGAGGTTSVQVTHGTAMPTINTPTKDDHLFDGYYDGDGGKGTKYYNADGTSAKNWDKENATLYAKWIPYTHCIFFKNTLSWSDVYIYTFTDNAYWDNGTGVHPGTNKLEQGKMTQLDKTDIYYYILTDLTGFRHIAFSDYDMRGYELFNDHKAIYRSDRSDQMPLFIPQKDQTPTGDTYTTNKYYSSGIWMKYNSTESGYKWSSDQNGWNTDANPFTASAKGGYTFTTTVSLLGSTTYQFKVNNIKGDWYSKVGTMTQDDCTDWWFQPESDPNKNAVIQPNVTGDYVFTVYLGDGKVEVSLEYPLGINDYRLSYYDAKTGLHPGHYIKKRNEDRLDTVSFFIHTKNNPELRLERCTAIDPETSTATWEILQRYDVLKTSGAAPTSAQLPGKSKSDAVLYTGEGCGIEESGVYNFVLQQSNSTADLQTAYTHPYVGDFYIRTDAADGGWDAFRQQSNKITYSSFADSHSNFNHYYCKYIEAGSNVKFTIANDYSYCISDTLDNDAIIQPNQSSVGCLPVNANVRFGWDSNTNEISRAYIKGAGMTSDRFLVLQGNEHLKDANGKPIPVGTGNRYGLNANEEILVDQQNWIYQVDVTANNATQVKLIAEYNGTTQYFKGNETEYTGLLSSTASDTYTIRLVYDFKSNHLIIGWLAGGNTVEGEQILGADMMVIRRDQQPADQLNFDPTASPLNEVGIGYAVMTFTKDHILDNDLSERERSLYWVSFPFDVKISDVFGFGEYAEHWIIQYYDGAERAEKGLFIDSGTYWKYIFDTDTKLKAGEGYVLVLDLNKIEFLHGATEVSLYFPSTNPLTTITGNLPTADTVPEHWCNIDREFEDDGTRYNHKFTDSHWNLIGVPGFADITGFDVTQYSFMQDDASFYYNFSLKNSTYTVESSSATNFQAMYAYMVQFAGTINWSTTPPEVSPAELAARRHSDDQPEKVVLRLELAQGEEVADRTFVQLQQEGATANFDLSLDLTKIVNIGVSNIYTLTDSLKIQTAGNVLPFEETTVAVGVDIATAGEYTFRMPDGTEGMVVELIDYETNTTTNLLLDDYTVNLPTGSNETRFALSLKPEKTATSIESTTTPSDSNIRKFIIDGKLYLQKDGMLYDAQGHIVR